MRIAILWYIVSRSYLRLPVIMKRYQLLGSGSFLMGRGAFQFERDYQIIARG
jgi:hypothetical protein